MSERQNFDTTFTKIYVVGLPWTTRKEGLKSFFQQFGEVVHANVVCDRQTDRSKGYGFVTFKDVESARRACIDKNPIIDGRRANCKLASDCEKLNQNQPNIHHDDLCYMAPTFMQNQQQQLANFHQPIPTYYNEPYYWNQYQHYVPYHLQPQFHAPYHPQPQFYVPYHPQPQYCALYYPQPHHYAQHNPQSQYAPQEYNSQNNYSNYSHQYVPYDPQSMNVPRENQAVSPASTPRSSLE